MVLEAGAFFSRWMTHNIIFHERDKRIVDAIRIAVDRCFSAARLV